jgi:hypothetical protein
VKSGSLEAHLKVSRAWEADFWFSIKWAICCWVGTWYDDVEEEEDNEMGFDFQRRRRNLWNASGEKIARVAELGVFGMEDWSFDDCQNLISTKNIYNNLISSFKQDPNDLRSSIIYIIHHPHTLKSSIISYVALRR